MKEAKLILFKTVPYNSPLELLKREVERTVSNWDIDGKPVAIKLHFGEKGSTRFIRSIYIAAVVEALKNLKSTPFCTDTGVLYKSMRALAPTHLEVATKHGFNYSTLGCSTIIADGIYGHEFREIDFNGKYFKKVPVAAIIASVDHLVVVTHVTFHGFSGLGSTIKNIGMGCVSYEGKVLVHQSTIPDMDLDKCNACATCLKRCRFGALSIKNGKTKLDLKKCTGCCHCMGVCLNNVFTVKDEKYLEFCEKLVEASFAVIKNKKVLYLNFLSEITKQCDCASFTHPPVCKDIGILVSDNLYAIEAATHKLLDKEMNYSQSDTRPEFILNKIIENSNDKDTKYEIREVVK